MRRLTGICFLALSLLTAAPALAGGDSAGVNDDVVWVNPTTPGTPAGGGGTGSSGVGSPCDYSPVAADPRNVEAGQGQKDIDGVTHYLFFQDCNDGLPIGPVWVPRLTPADLIPDVQALVEQRLHYPTLTLTPFDPEFEWTYVQVPVDFRIASTEWAPVEAYAEASNPLGAVWIRATATPVELVLDPGDGSDLVRCGGTDPVAAYEWETPGACSVTYSNSSATARNGQSFSAVVAIVWDVTWESSDPNESGRFDVVPTETPIEVSVAEAKALVYCTGSRASQGGC